MKHSIYSDLNQNYGSRDKVEDINSVYQSIGNLIQTDKGSRIFRPWIGCDVGFLLFEPMHEHIATQLYDTIVFSLMNQEKRIFIDFGQTDVVADYEGLKYELSLAFEIVGIKGTSFKYVDSLIHRKR